MIKFLIIGNKNAITYKEIFPYIKNNQLWLGLNSPCDFSTPSGEITKTIAGLCRWFTNIENKKRNQPLDLYKKYNQNEYPKYDNYDAIEVSKVTDIPEDYDGVIGVPITSLKYLYSDGKIHANIDGVDTKFDILDARETALNDKQKNKSTYLIKDADSAINGKPTYARICIKKVSYYDNNVELIEDDEK